VGAVLKFPQPDQDNMVKLIQAFARRVCIYTFTRGADQLLPTCTSSRIRFPAIPTIAGFDVIVLCFGASAVAHTCSSSRRVPDPLTAGLLRSRFPTGLGLSGRYVLPGRSTGFDHCSRDLGLDTKPDFRTDTIPGV